MSGDVGHSSEVPGQGVLPGFEEILKIESAVLSKPEQEAFCWEFVTNGGKPGPAYLATINSDASPENARSYACKLLKKSNIKQRITEISGIIQRKYEHEVLAFRLRALNFDAKAFFKENGEIKRIHEMTNDERRGVGLEARFVDGAIRYLPVFPSPEKAAEAIQKMFGLEKVGMSLSGGMKMEHSGAVGFGVTDDVERFDLLRQKFSGMKRGETGPS